MLFIPLLFLIYAIKPGGFCIYIVEVIAWIRKMKQRASGFSAARKVQQKKAPENTANKAPEDAVKKAPESRAKLPNHAARSSAPKALSARNPRRHTSAGSISQKILGNKRSLAAAVTVSVFLLVGAVIMTVFLSGDGSIAAMSLNTGGSAKFTVNVVEGYTDAPITGAKVVILETGKTYSTDTKGDTGIIEVPVKRDIRFDSIIPKPWGEVSLIVYKDGFLPYALFYLQVMGNETRTGVKVLLFENNSTGSSEPFSIIEGPNRAWVNELVKKFQPKEEPVEAPIESMDITP